MSTIASNPSDASSSHPRWVYASFCLAYLAVYMAALAAGGVRLDLNLRNAVTATLPEALLGIAVLRLPHTVRWPGTDRSGFYAMHAWLLLAFLALSTALWTALVGLDGVAFGEGFKLSGMLRILPWRLMLGGLVYGALAGVAYARHNAAAIREQAARAARAEALRARAELAAMRSQLNPHFILNTLHALAGLVRRDPATAEEAIERLGDLLRYGLRVHREGTDEVRLRDEWAFVESYLALERMRLGERLRLDVRLHHQALDCRVPCFGLQTLVENAIRHAISTRSAGGTLAIRACRERDRLRVEVRDDGPGAPWDQAIANGGLGLRLLRDRVAALYPGEGRLVLANAPGGGASATLDLPCRDREEAR